MKKIFTLLWLAITAFTFKATAQGTTCNAEFAIQFINSNTVKFNPVITEGAPLVTHTWHFGDGSPISNLVSPTHVYALPGTYVVVHTLARVNQNNVPVCTQSFTKQVIISPTTACNLVVNFSWTAASTNPLMITFQNLSVPLAATDSITWQFGDNTTSHAVNPVHTYASAGTYNVCLIVKKWPQTTNAPCIKYICKTVVVNPPCNLVVDFNWTVTPSNPLRLEFHSIITPAAANDSIRWTFGDGHSSNQANPVHTYTAPGTYTVCLKVIRYNGNTTTPCIRDTCKTVVVTTPACNLVVDFSWAATPTNPLRIEFNNLSVPLSTTDSIKWTFGDGSTSMAVNPVHTYTAPGTYTVCLTVKKHPTTINAPCIRTICKTIVIPAPCNLVVNFSTQPDSVIPLRMKFTNLSTPMHATDSVRWTFGDGTSLSGLQGDPNVANPIHNYTHAGNYTVCLRIKKNNNSTPSGSCVREKCQTIVVPLLCTLVANFTSQPDPVVPLRMKFTNTSTPSHASDSVRWTFGDGTSLSGLQGDPNIASPTHNYTSAGNYTVCIRVKKNNTINTPPTAICVREKCSTIVVHIPCTLVANFTSQPDPVVPLRVKFTNTSTPSHASDSVRWTFGDGTSLSGLQGDPNIASPTHNYANAGNYTVCIRVKKSNTINTPPAALCVREKCTTIVVPIPCTLVANFTSQPDPVVPLRVKFTNTSTPSHASDSVRWTFGDGTSLSGLQGDPNIASPTHNYASAGNYTVCIRVKKNNNTTAGGSCVREKCYPIVVTHPCNFPVNFSWQPDAANPRKIHFTNLSTPPTATAIAVWNFGDGSSATSWNAIHEYAQPGAYRVCLRIYLGTTSNCVREFCDTVYVPHPVPPCNQLSKYTYERFTNDIQKYKFTPDYINTTFQYTWTFGDGTGSHDPIAIHRYAQPGVYTACLTVWNGPNCASTTCKQIVVQQQVLCDTAHVSYTYQANPQVPNKISFYASGTLPILDQTWTITRVGSTLPPVILHQNNPVYTFPAVGTYRVCLRATLMGGCVKEYCNNINITQVSNACTLQAFPNPVSSLVNVNVYLTQPFMIHAYVYNSLNVLVLDKHQQGYTGNNLVTMNVGALPAGQYTIKVLYGNSICYASFQKL